VAKYIYTVKMVRGQRLNIYDANMARWQRLNVFNVKMVKGTEIKYIHR